MIDTSVPTDVKNSIRLLYEARQEEKRTKKYLDEVNQKESLLISNYMYSSKVDDCFNVTLDEGRNYYASHVKLKVQKIRNKKIVWFIDKLKQTLTKEQQKAVIDKTYEITDMDGLINYLKSCGVKPKEFKKYISVKEIVNEQKLDNANQKGLIKKKSSAVDSRKNFLFVTEKGEELLNKINRQSDEQINSLFQSLTTSEIDEILNSMMIIKERLNNL